MHILMLLMYNSLFLPMYHLSHFKFANFLFDFFKKRNSLHFIS